MADLNNQEKLLWAKYKKKILDKQTMTYSSKMKRYTVRAVYPGSQRIC